MARWPGQLQQHDAPAAQAPPRSVADHTRACGKWLAHFRDALNIALADLYARSVIYEKVQALGSATGFLPGARVLSRQPDEEPVMKA